ncbi:hypothetical protein [Brevibacterium sp. ZH18]|uniref:hypothetical protein n=1 Tax=Brevibacterium sp. ZH18 TaxID=2927784 RepID=UPI001F61FD8C|nr:hypothetical protein [Brevibacterium sp. ZH18]MCI4010183.1 hypothetical protein [Brevibacterium sp. ZH18]
MARAGRVGLVREALGIAAYHVEKYDEAVRELRTHRRISGSNDNMALIADAERGRGKPQKALELYESASELELDNDTRTELVIVAAGAKSDLGDLKGARALIEAEDFTQKPSGALVRLMAAYAGVLRLHGEGEMADKYEELSRRTAKATGTLFGDEEPDPNFGVEIETVEEIPDEDETEFEDSDEDLDEDENELEGDEDESDEEGDDFDDDESDSSVSFGSAASAASTAAVAADFAQSEEAGSVNGFADDGNVDDAESGDLETGFTESESSAAEDSNSVDEEAESADSDFDDSTDFDGNAEFDDEDSSELDGGVDDAAAEQAPAKSKTQVSEKELKKIKISDDEIEAELDEILAEVEESTPEGSAAPESTETDRPNGDQ